MSNTLTTDMLEARTRLSRLVQMVESGDVDEVVIARNGRPAARLVRIEARPPIQIGLARGEFTVPDSIDRSNSEIQRLFEGSVDAPSP